MREHGVSVQYLLSDHLGSTSLVVNTSGTIVAQNRYMPWGEVRYSLSDTLRCVKPPFDLCDVKILLPK
jgi:hypothetical protein